MKSAERVFELRKNNPQLPAAEIARITGLSRERVRQILVSLGLAANVEKEGWGKITLVCDNCGKEFTRLGSQYRHSIAKQGCRHTYCSRRCLWQVIGRNYGFGKLKSRNQPAEESVDALS